MILHCMTYIVGNKRSYVITSVSIKDKNSCCLFSTSTNENNVHYNQPIKIMYTKYITFNVKQISQKFLNIVNRSNDSTSNQFSTNLCLALHNSNLLLKPDSLTTLR